VTEQAEPEPAVVAAPELRPAGLRLNLTGKAEAVFGTATAIPVELTRAGEEEPIATEFTPGALTRLDLAPGDYAVTRIGPMSCTGVEFTLTPGSEPRGLGALNAEIMQTEYDLALVSAGPAGATDLAALGPGAQSAPLFVDRRALCHAGRGGSGTQFYDLSPAEQVMTVILFGGICAAAVASGGFCIF